MNDTPTPTNDEWIVTDNENYIEIASIKTCDSIASVHGGKTVGDQYDLAGRIARVPQLERDLTAAREELKAVIEQRDRLAEAIRLTLMENLDLCDGDQCTLKCLKDAIGFDLDSLENTKDQERTASA